MIDIKDISGNTILSVPITQECERIEELMQSDHAVLSWSSEKDDILPLGAYIEYEGERLSLLEPYSPEQKDELERLYNPLFQSKIMVWRKTPFFMYTRVNGTITSREADWTLTDNPANFMATICDAIKNETGETWTYSVDASLLASTSLSFQSIDIFSSLNQIAEAFETEWWVDKANKVIHLSEASHGTAVTLEVGVNIKTPSVTSGKQGYFTRFYAFGSTRNITQDYKGANVNNLVNKRLTLEPSKFPDGYKDIREGLKQGEVFSKVLLFDDIYPSSKMAIADVRSRLMWVLGDDGEKIQVGTDSEGNAIYDQCAVWYFQIPGFVFNNTKFDKDKNPDGMLIEGKNTSVHFESGPLSGREFELIYHDTAKTISTSDGLTFKVKKGDFEIKFIQEENYIIPDMAALVPVDGNNIILFNVKMPSEYTASAYEDLENALDKEMKRLVSDLNNYQFDSNPVSFQSNNPNLSIGQIVTYKNGTYSYSTRVIKLTTKMDYTCEQNITIGNEQVKGTVQELKEEVVSANKDLNLLQVFNDMTTSLQQSYARTQQMMLDGFAAIKNIWQLKEDENGNKYAQSAFHLVTERGITFNASETPIVPSVFAALPHDDTLAWIDNKLSVVGGGGSGINGIKVNGSTYSPDADNYITIPDYSTSLAWGDITGKPSTLAGYGITDAANNTGVGASGDWGINSASATKLQTPRIIWGQSFDGTGDVSGDLTCNSIHLQFNDEINRHGGDLYIQHRYTGTEATRHVFMCANGGNVGIGTVSPTYKLDVTGELRATGWLYTNTGYYHSNGVAYTAVQAYAEISSGGNEIVISGANDMHVNYRQGQYRSAVPNTWYWRNGTSTGWCDFNIGNLNVNGNLFATGGLTFRYSSDRTLKTNIHPVTDASKRLMSLGGIFDFEYIPEEIAKNRIYAGSHTGLIYQNVKGTCMDKMCHVREDGKGNLNYIDTSFISLLAAVGMEHETRLQAVESTLKERGIL